MTRLKIVALHIIRIFCLIVLILALIEWFDDDKGFFLGRSWDGLSPGEHMMLSTIICFPICTLCISSIFIISDKLRMLTKLTITIEEHVIDHGGG